MDIINNSAIKQFGRQCCRAIQDHHDIYCNVLAGYTTSRAVPLLAVAGMSFNILVSFQITRLVIRFLKALRLRVDMKYSKLLLFMPLEKYLFHPLSPMNAFSNVRLTTDYFKMAMFAQNDLSTKLKLVGLKALLILLAPITDEPFIDKSCNIPMLSTIVFCGLEGYVKYLISSRIITYIFLYKVPPMFQLSMVNRSNLDKSSIVFLQRGILRVYIVRSCGGFLYIRRVFVYVVHVNSD